VFVVAFAVLASFGGVATAAASGTVRASDSLKSVTAFGVSVSVPRAWPVVDFRFHPMGCTRLDRHAVYIGLPSNTNCPARLVGSVAGVHLRRANPLELAAAEPATPVNPFGVAYRGGDLINSVAMFLLGGGRTVVSVTRGDPRAGRAVMATVRPATSATT